MRGLRKPEGERFERFFSLVQKEASAKGCVFFCDAGDGRDFVMDDMEGEDLFGWLIPLGKADAFEKDWADGKPVPDGWDSRYRSAEWMRTQGTVRITFRDYQ